MCIPAIDSSCYVDKSQITEYFAGIGTNERPLEKFNCGVTGEGCAEQIARVYKVCHSKHDPLRNCAHGHGSIAAKTYKVQKTSSGSTASAVVHVSPFILVSDLRRLLTLQDVVTAVAGLLDKIGALVYDDHFDKTYETALNLHKAIQKGFVRENSGKVNQS